MTDRANEFDSLRQLLENARGVIQMPAFAKWKESLEGQIQGRTGQILNPVKSQDHLLEQEYQKGEIAGMMFAVQFWDLLVESMTDELKRIQTTLDEEQNQ